MLLFIGGLTASAQTYQQEGLFPLTAGSYWMQDNGHVAAVVSAADSGGTLSVLITNWNSLGQPIVGYLRLVADATEVRGTAYSNPDYIIVDDDMGYYPFLKRPMTSGRTWNSQWNSNGYPIYQTAVVTGTNLLLAIGSTIHNGCTELTVTSSYPNGYTPGQVKWVNSKYYFSPGVGCVRRILTSDTGLKQTNNVVAWQVNGFSSRPIGFATMPASQTASAGGVTTFSASAFGLQPLKYQWRKNGTNLVNGGRVTGATSTNLNLSNTQAADSGSYSVVVSNAYGSVTSAVAVLNVVTPPSSFVLLDYFNPLVEGNEWHYSGTDYDGQPSTRVDRVANRDWPVTAYTGRSTPRTYTTNLVRLNKAYDFPTYDDWDDFFGDQGTLAFWGHNDGSDSGRVDGGLVLPPSLNLGQSASVTRDFYDRGVYQGSVTFKLTAVSWGSVTVPAGTFEDCLKVRIVITGGGESETQDEWWARGVGAVKHRNVPDDGEEQLDLLSYSVVAPVRIVTPPRAQTNSLGGVATFSVIASGSPPLSYQWRKNDVDLADDVRISGATSNLLVIAGLKFADAGSYSVRVANDHDSVVSSAAVLTVNDALPPVVNVTSHVESQLLGSANVTLAGTASDADRGDNGIASVTVNGIRAANDTVAGNATANWSRMFNLVLGTNKITVVARDGRGNAATNIIRLLADTASPTASITVPAANARLSNAVATVQGKAGDNLGLAEVRYQLNGTGWATATPSPTGWSNWSAILNLAPGTNTLNAYAVDVAGNQSLTNTVRFVYVLTAPLGVNIVGNGKVNGVTDGQLFEIGKSVAPTVTPATGWILTNWLVTVDGNTIRSTNKAVPFLMASNTVVTAKFVDVAKPTLTITAPKLNQRWSNEVFTVAGKVTDNNTNGSVWYQLNGGTWTSASGWTNWSASVNLIAGTNHVKAYAVDAAGNRSTTNSVNVIYVLTYCLADYFYSAPSGSRLIYDGLDWDGFPAQLKVEIKDADHPLVTYSGTTTVSNYVINVLHIESAYGTYISGTGQFSSYDDWDEYFIMGGCSFGWVGSDDDDESLRVDRGFLITNRVAIGQTISLTRGIYLDGSYVGQATLKLQLLDVSTVTVPAGTYPGCLRVRLTVSAGGESQTHDDWLAPGIGMVKQQGVSGDGAAERWELIRYEPPTQTPLQWIVPDDGSAVADGQMQWRVAGPNGQAFVVEGSSDLRDWIPLHTNAIPAEGLLLSIPVGPQPAQFFRLRAVQP